MDEKPATVTDNPWQALRQFTDARIALGRAGVSLPTMPQLAFQLAHARARDAVHLALDVRRMASQLADFGTGCITLHSQAADRQIYLQRPDLGRRLNAQSRAELISRQPTASAETRPYDLAFAVVDGLSALAIEQNTVPFLSQVQRRLAAENWSLAPICIVEQGRVAIGDEVGELLGAKLVVVLIGERPGLSSPDSMGLYLTWMPKLGLTDASRNCISNVRPAGLSYEEAAYKLHYLLSEARQRQLSGVQLKDETAGQTSVLGSMRGNFLLEADSRVSR